MPGKKKSSSASEASPGGSRKLGSSIVPKPKSIRQSKSKRAGIVFPVGRILRFLRKGHFADHIQNGKKFFIKLCKTFINHVVRLIYLHRRCSVHGRCNRIPGCRNNGNWRQRSNRQQEVANHPASLNAVSLQFL